MLVVLVVLVLAQEGEDDKGDVGGFVPASALLPPPNLPDGHIVYVVLACDMTGREGVNVSMGRRRTGNRRSKAPRHTQDEELDD